MAKKLRIKKAIKRPGALRRKFAKWFGLKKGEKIPRSMYAKGYKRAKKRGDTRTMRQIDFARTIQGLAKRARKRKAIRRKKKNSKKMIRPPLSIRAIADKNRGGKLRRVTVEEDVFGGVLRGTIDGREAEFYLDDVGYDNLVVREV